MKTWLVWGGILALGAVLYQGVLKDILSDRGQLTIVSGQNGGAEVVMQWQGSIRYPMAERIREIYAERAGTAQRFVLLLHSSGGSVQHGRRVIRALNDVARTHDLTTVVDAGRRCASMCVPVFLAGTNRLAAPEARFMFHEVQITRGISDERIDVGDDARAEKTADLLARDFQAPGVDPTWVERLKGRISGNRDLWLTARQLQGERSGIVTRLM